jgi:uncharacterized cofD-like protein
MKKSTSDAKFVVIGGGTGSFAVLNGLKTVATDITALVSMADDGGSTGMLRDELGVLPPGDIRQCLVALSDPNTSQTLRDLFNFRFEEGSFAGHSFGNLFLSAVEKMTNDFGEAVRLAGELLHITGRVMPITHDNVRLAIQWDDKIVRGEGTIDVMDFAVHKGTKPKLFLEPHATINPQAAHAIADADVVVIAPGDIYTSLGPLLVVDGVAEALLTTKARVVYLCNLVLKPHQTAGFSVDTHVEELERFVGKPFIDAVLYNTGMPTAEQLRHYDKAGENLVKLVRTQGEKKHYETIGCDLLSRVTPEVKRGDKLAAHRSLIRHDAQAIAQALLRFTVRA